MSLMSRVNAFLQTRANPENPSTNLANAAQWLIDWAGGGPSESGIPVNQKTSMNLGVAFACVRILSQTIASLPRHGFKHLDPRGKDRYSRAHPLEKLLKNPNPRMTQFLFTEQLMANVVTVGNGYAHILRDGGNRPVQMWPLSPSRVEPMLTENGGLVYRYRRDSQPDVFIDSMDMLHIPGLMFDGVKGLSALTAARESIGLGLAQQRSANRLFKNDARPGGILTTEKRLGKTGREGLASQFDLVHKNEPGRIAVLEDGLTYQPISFTPQDSEFVDQVVHNVRDVARFFGVPPHMVNDLADAKYANIEQQEIDFVTHTVRPWTDRWAQEMSRKLLPERDQEDDFIAFILADLLRGDLISRYESYAIGRQNGWLSADDVLSMEDKNPLPNGQGAVYLVPLNMIPADRVNEFADAELAARTGAGSSGDGSSSTPSASEKRPASTGGPSGVRRDLTGTGFEDYEFRALDRRRTLKRDAIAKFEVVGQSVVKREVEAIRKLAGKHLETRSIGTLMEELSGFYAKDGEFMKTTADAILPVLRAYAMDITRAALEEVEEPFNGLTPELESFVASYAATFAQRYSTSSLKQFESILAEKVEATATDALEERLSQFEERRPMKVAKREAVQAGNALAKIAWSVAGVVALRWIANKGACPYCQELDGKTSSVRTNFVSQGDGTTPPGERTMISKGSVGHPPLHEDCECDIVPSR